MNDGTDAGEGTHTDVREAALIGTMWLNVRGQHPFHGPNPGAFAAVTLIAGLAAMFLLEGALYQAGARRA